MADGAAPARARALRPKQARDAAPPPSRTFSRTRARYVETVEPAIRFLQGRDPSLALRIVGRDFLPEGPRFAAALDDETAAWAFGALGTTEQARYLASLYVDDLADVWRDGIDPRFELARYGEKLAASAPTLRSAARGARRRADAGRRRARRDHARAARHARARRRGHDRAVSRQRLRRVPHGAGHSARPRPDAKLVLGGGCVNTELRALREPRVFDYFDYVTLDDGERPLLNLLRAAARRATRRWCAPTCARGQRRARDRPHAARLPAARHRHADLRRPAARTTTCRCSRC